MAGVFILLSFVLVIILSSCGPDEKIARTQVDKYWSFPESRTSEPLRHFVYLAHYWSIGDQLVVPPGVPNQMTYTLSTEIPQSPMPPSTTIDASRKLDERIGIGKTYFDVVVQCSICDPAENVGIPKRMAIERLIDGSVHSSEVRFSFTPLQQGGDRDARPAGDAQGITIFVQLDGKTYDHLNIPILVQTDSMINTSRDGMDAPHADFGSIGPATTGNLAIPVNLSVAPELPPPGDAANASIDVFLTPGREDEAYALDLVIRGSYANVLAQKYFPAETNDVNDPNRWHFATNISDLTAARDISQDTYLALTCLLVNRDTEEGEKIYQYLRKQYGVCLSDPPLKALQTIGLRIYERIFSRASGFEKFLSELVVYSASRTPTDLHFYLPRNIYIPVQLIYHRIEDIKTPGFFGYLFNTSIMYTATQNSASLHPVSGGLLYAGYSEGVAPARSVVGPADRMTVPELSNFINIYEGIRATMKKRNIRVSPYIGTPKSLLDNLVAGKAFDIAWILTHGRARSTNEVEPGFSYGTGSSLLFFLREDGGRLTKSGMDIALPADNELFPAHPIVGLIACESGVTFFNPQGVPDLARAFLGRGARGILLSEAEIPIATAEDFGQRFLSAVLKGDNPAAASRSARIALLNGATQDPFGLIISFISPVGGPNGSNVPAVPARANY